MTAPHVQRMLVERYELYEKELALGRFINENPVFKELGEERQGLMEEQLSHMTKYREVLERRIKLEEA